MAVVGHEDTSETTESFTLYVSLAHLYLLLDHAQITHPAPAWKGVCSPKCPKAPSVVQGRGLSDGLKLLEQYVCGDVC